jgi:hypothetical protein
MSNVVQLPSCKKDVAKEEVVTRLSKVLYDARIDPSDEPEAAFHLLYAMNVYHWSVISEHFEDIIYDLGQRYIADEIARAI